jgi:hypothetical protein
MIQTSSVIFCANCLNHCFNSAFLSFWFCFSELVNSSVAFNISSLKSSYHWLSFLNSFVSQKSTSNWNHPSIFPNIFPSVLLYAFVNPDKKLFIGTRAVFRALHIRGHKFEKAIHILSTRFHTVFLKFQKITDALSNRYWNRHITFVTAMLTLEAIALNAS